MAFQIVYDRNNVTQNLASVWMNPINETQNLASLRGGEMDGLLLWGNIGI